MNSRQDILNERTRRLATIVEEKEESKNAISTIQFVIESEQFAMESRYIQEAYPLNNLTTLPCAPPYIYGVMNVRRRIISIVDLGEIFELPRIKEKTPKKIIILEHENMNFGILVNKVLGVRLIQAEEIQPSLPTITGIRQKFFKGVTSDGLVLLDGEKILTEEKIIVTKELP